MTICGTLISMLWALFMVVIHVIVTIIISYWSAKLAARPILGEAIKIRKAVLKGIESLSPGTIAKSLAGKKGGAVKPDPIGSWMEKNVPFVGSFLKGNGQSTANKSRIQEVVDEVKAKHGMKSSKTDIQDDTLPI